MMRICYEGTYIGLPIASSRGEINYRGRQADTRARAITAHFMATVQHFHTKMSPIYLSIFVEELRVRVTITR